MAFSPNADDPSSHDRIDTYDADFNSYWGNAIGSTAVERIITYTFSSAKTLNSVLAKFYGYGWANGIGQNWNCHREIRLWYSGGWNQIHYASNSGGGGTGYAPSTNWADNLEVAGPWSGVTKLEIHSYGYGYADTGSGGSGGGGARVYEVQAWAPAGGYSFIL